MVQVHPEKDLNRVVPSKLYVCVCIIIAPNTQVLLLLFFTKKTIVECATSTVIGSVHLFCVVVVVVDGVGFFQPFFL